MSSDLERVDIEKILQRLGIEAKKKGKEWFAICPNPDHADQTPSWRIRDEPGATKHGYFKCWPCSFQGGLVDLVMKLLKIEERKDAKEWILGASPLIEQKPVERVEVQVRRASLGFHLPDEVVVSPIAAWPSPARDYWISRGLGDWQADRWGCGYAVEGRLKGRIVLVTRDVKGKPLRYTARSFGSSEKRYLEPDPSEKAKEGAMFGEQHWPTVAARAGSPIFLVEGAINGLALEAEMPGVYFGATAGSSMRAMYATKLSTFGAVCVLSDPDAAGDKLFTEIVQGVGRHVALHRMRLDVGMDPAKLRTLRPGELGSKVRSWLRETWRASDTRSLS